MHGQNHIKKGWCCSQVCIYFCAKEYLEFTAVPCTSTL